MCVVESAINSRGYQPTHAGDVVAVERRRGHDLHVRVQGLEVGAGAGDGAAGAERGDEVSDFLLRLQPELGSRGLKVCSRVGYVGVLVRPEGPGPGGELGGARNGALRRTGFGSKVVFQLVHLGAEHPQRVALFGGNLVAHDCVELDAARVAEHGQADGGVAA
jgi:hypothetical protein